MKLARLPVALCMLLRVNAAASAGRVSTPSLVDLLSMHGEDVEEAPSDLSIRGGPKVPGDNNLFLCNSDHDDDIWQVEEVDFLPNPPQR